MDDSECVERAREGLIVCYVGGGVQAEGESEYEVAEASDWDGWNKNWELGSMAAALCSLSYNTHQAEHCCLPS